jgi:hypothetical protein
MRTKVISRWRKAAVAAAAAASLAAPGARAQDKGQPVEDGPARSAAAAEPPRDVPAPSDVPAPPIEDGPAPSQRASEVRGEVRGQLTTPLQPQGEPQIYVIRKGDTLWDLSQKFLSNPWYWPRIWSLNPSIENPHWIYPGNRLKVTPGQGGAPAQVEVTAQAGPPGEAPRPADEEPLPATPPSGPADFGVAGKDATETEASYRAVSASGRLSFTPPKSMNTRVSGLISAEELDEAGVIDGSFEEKQLLATYDTAYVRFPREPGMKAGDRLVIFRPEGNIIDPTNHRKLAAKVRTLGVAHVVGVNEDSLTVQIESTLEEIARGDLVRPWIEQKKRVAPKPNRTAVEGVIIASTTSDLVTLGEAHEVYINRGSKDGVEEGNTFTVVQRGDGLGTIGGGFTSYTGGAGQMSNAPEETVGLLIVLDVKDHVSTAVVVKSIRELEPGQRVAMRTDGAPGAGGE